MSAFESGPTPAIDDILNFEYEPQWGYYSQYERRIIRNRFLNIRDTFNLFSSQLPDEMSAGIKLNKTRLYLVCGYYVNDLKEVRTFHQSKGVGPVRRAAFLARQIARVSPVETEDVFPDIMRNSGHPGRGLFLAQANARFAIKIFADFLGLSQDFVSTELFAELERDLIFLFQFRDTPKEALVATAKLLLALNEG